MALTQAVRQVTQNETLNEGKLTAAIEHQTAKLPSMVYLNLAFASIAASLTATTVSPRAPSRRKASFLDGASRVAWTLFPERSRAV